MLTYFFLWNFSNSYCNLLVVQQTLQIWLTMSFAILPNDFIDYNSRIKTSINFPTILFFKIEYLNKASLFCEIFLKTRYRTCRCAQKWPTEWIGDYPWISQRFWATMSYWHVDVHELDYEHVNVHCIYIMFVCRKRCIHRHRHRN
jgi:hypothetical protein